MRRVAISALAVGVAVLVVAAIVALRGRDGGFELAVELPDAHGLVPGSDVKVHGIVVGSIKRLTLTRRDTALTTFELDDSVRVGRGARGTVRAANLLGEKYLNLQVGDPRRRLAEGTRIAAGHLPVELDDVINMLDDRTRARLKILLNEAGIALLGRGTDLNRMLEELPASLDSTTALVDQVASENRRLGELVDHADGFTTEMAARRRQLGRLVEGARQALAAPARKQRELEATVAAAPAALRQLNGSLKRVESVAHQLGPSAVALRAAAPPLADALREVPGFAKAATPALHALTRAAPELEGLARAGRGPVRRLRPALSRIAELAAALAPVTKALDRGGALKNLLDYISGSAGATRRSDGLAHYIRIHFQIDESLVTSLVAALADTVKPQRRRGAGKKPTGSPPAAADEPRGAAPDTAPRPKVRVPEVLRPVQDALRGTVAPTVDRLEGVLDHLLGP